MTAKFQGHTLHAGSRAKLTRNSPEPSKSLLQAWVVKSQIKSMSPQAFHVAEIQDTPPHTHNKKAKVSHHFQKLGAPVSTPQIPVYIAMRYSVVLSLKIPFSLA